MNIVIEVIYILVIFRFGFDNFFGFFSYIILYYDSLKIELFNVNLF